MTSLRDIKAKYADGDSPGSESDAADTTEAEEESGSSEPAGDATPDEDDAPEQDEDASADEEDEKPKPAASGESHQPRTDAEIGEGGSLFDL